MLKTIRRDEFQFLKKILVGYFEHIKNNKDTLIPKFFGLHKLVYRKKKYLRGWLQTKKVYFIIMNNLFNSELEIHKRYDLKGSTYKRSVSSMEPGIAKKDLDFIRDERKLGLETFHRDELLAIIEKDLEFFKKHRIIDYSLMVGYHTKGPVTFSPFNKTR